MKQLLTAAAALALSLPLFGQVAEGDHQWALRGEGAAGAHASPAHVDAAIAAYHKAVSANPNDLEAQWKLLRAYRFKGAYTATSSEEKKKVYGIAKSAGAQALAVVGRQLAGHGIASLDKASEKQVAEAARAVPGADEVFLWDAVNWGEWALAYGKLAAAREGAADRIRREATIAMMADPHLDSGTPQRVLGRLHDQTPRIPFLTGWASSKEAVRFLTESLRIGPGNKLTMLFLAEALVSSDGSKKPEAIQLLRNLISSPADPAFAVEDAAAIADARALLSKWGA